MGESQRLELVDATGCVLPAEVLVFEQEDEEYRVQIRWAEKEIAASGHDAFSALCAVRKQLAEVGLTPRCYGACRNLVVSGMSSQMSGGMKGYLVRLGHPASMSDLVDIFDAGQNMDLVSVPEQEEFKLQWFRSLGLPG